MSNNGWLGILAAITSGPGMASYTVAPNSGVARTGSLTVAGLNFIVTQAGHQRHRLPERHSPSIRSTLALRAQCYHDHRL